MHWRPVSAITVLATDLHRPACIDIFLGRLSGLAMPDLVGRFARLDVGLFFLGVALLECGHQYCVDNLTAHGEIANLAQLLLERLHQHLERTVLG